MEGGLVGLRRGYSYLGFHTAPQNGFTAYTSPCTVACAMSLPWDGRIQADLELCQE